MYIMDNKAHFILYGFIPQHRGPENMHYVNLYAKITPSKTYPAYSYNPRVYGL